MLDISAQPWLAEGNLLLRQKHFVPTQSPVTTHSSSSFIEFIGLSTAGLFWACYLEKKKTWASPQLLRMFCFLHRPSFSNAVVEVCEKRKRLKQHGSFYRGQRCKRRTHISGKSTGLVRILLCKASMYSSINGHYRWSRAKGIKTTRKAHLITQSAPKQLTNKLRK